MQSAANRALSHMEMFVKLPLFRRAGEDEGTTSGRSPSASGPSKSNAGKAKVICAMGKSSKIQGSCAGASAAVKKEKTKLKKLVKQLPIKTSVATPEKMSKQSAKHLRTASVAIETPCRKERRAIETTSQKAKRARASDGFAQDSVKVELETAPVGKTLLEDCFLNMSQPEIDEYLLSSSLLHAEVTSPAAKASIAASPTFTSPMEKVQMAKKPTVKSIGRIGAFAGRAKHQLQVPKVRAAVIVIPATCIGADVEFRGFQGCTLGEICDDGSGAIKVAVPELGLMKAAHGAWKLKDDKKDVGEELGEDQSVGLGSFEMPDCADLGQDLKARVLAILEPRARVEYF